MKISEIISEILNVNGPEPETKWHTSYGGDTSTGKWIDPTGKEVNTIFDKNGRGGADVSFSRDQVAANNKGITAGGGRPSYNVTGTSDGSAPKILTGVIQNIKNYLDKNPDVNQIKFISVDPSRTKAYSRMIDRLAPNAGLVGTRVDRGSNETEFVLSRTQPGQKQAAAPATPTVKAPVAPTVAPPAAATKLPLPPGRAIPNPLLNKPFTPSIAGSHGDSLYKFQGELDRIKRTMPRI